MFGWPTKNGFPFCIQQTHALLCMNMILKFQMRFRNNFEMVCKSFFGWDFEHALDKTVDINKYKWQHGQLGYGLVFEFLRLCAALIPSCMFCLRIRIHIRVQMYCDDVVNRSDSNRGEITGDARPCVCTKVSFNCVIVLCVRSVCLCMHMSFFPEDTQVKKNCLNSFMLEIKYHGNYQMRHSQCCGRSLYLNVIFTRKRFPNDVACLKVAHKIPVFTLKFKFKTFTKTYHPWRAHTLAQTHVSSKLLRVCRWLLTRPCVCSSEQRSLCVKLLS